MEKRFERFTMVQSFAAMANLKGKCELVQTPSRTLGVTHFLRNKQIGLAIDKPYRGQNCVSRPVVFSGLVFH